MQGIKSPEWRSKIRSKVIENYNQRKIGESTAAAADLAPDNNGYKPLLETEEADCHVSVIGSGKVDAESQPTDGEGTSNTLMIVFALMVVFGLGNKIFQKLQTIPMFNYPIFLNLLTTAVYIPLTFAYVGPMILWGTRITKEQREISKKKFLVMGSLDAVAGIMQVFSATFLGGALLILLSQAAIPVSMIISRLLLRSRYSIPQYIGASTVAVGIMIVLAPSLHGGDSENQTVIIWSSVMILSCVPMCLSSVYKEKALGKADLDPIYLNYYVAVFQFLLSIPLMIPSGYANSPIIPPEDLPKHLHDGFLCYLGKNSVASGPHPDDCAMSPVYVTVYLIFNVVYNVLIVLILKFGSANLLFLAMTIMVPLGNIAFTFPFMPNHMPLEWTDAVGLVIIMLGLVFYRFVRQEQLRCCAGIKESGRYEVLRGTYKDVDMEEGSKREYSIAKDANGGSITFLGVDGGNGRAKSGAGSGVANDNTITGHGELTAM